MDKREAVELAVEFGNAVNSKFGLAKIILFGSYAKANHNEDSDIDIAVILEDFSNLSSTRLELMRLRRSIDSRIEPHPFRKKDFEISNPFVHEIIKFGQVI